MGEQTTLTGTSSILSSFINPHPTLIPLRPWDFSVRVPRALERVNGEGLAVEKMLETEEMVIEFETTEDMKRIMCRSLHGKGTEHKVNSDDYKVAHREEVESGNIIFKATRTGSGSLSVDDQWVESVWGARNFGFVQIESRGRSGGLLLVWDTNSFSVKQSVGEDRFVAIMGTLKGRVGDIILANMYRPYPANQKVALWKRLEELINSNDAAWCLFGDFNEVRNQDDRLNTQFHVRESDDFNEFIANTHLIEVLIGGRRFTRVSDDGMKFTVALDQKLFDHCPIVLKDIDVDFGPRPFRLYCSRQIQECQNGRKKRFGAIDNQIKKYQEKAMRWELEAEARYLSEDELKAWMEARRLWIEKDGEKAKVMKQKARIKWDTEGDENSKFFHSIVKRKNNKNNIRGLLENGIWSEEPTEIKEEILRYYSNIFSKTRMDRPTFASNGVSKLSGLEEKNLESRFTEKEIWEAVSRCCSDKAPGPDENGIWSEEPTEIKEEILRYYSNIFSKTRIDRPTFASNGVSKLSGLEEKNLESRFTKKEIWEAVSRCCIDKAPGPDGFNFHFIKKFWEIVTDPIRLGDFRPISLIGCYYKTIAKLLAERLKVVVGKLVGDVQNAFINGRYILNEVLITNEIVNLLKQKKNKCLLFKVDFEKAYDSLNWEYLMDIMKCIGFGNKWRSRGVNVLVKDAVDRGMFNGVDVGREKIMKVSGLKVNLNKSRVYGVGVSRGEVEDMARWKWWWRARIEHEAMWVKVVKSTYGADGVMGDFVRMVGGKSGVWGDIVREGRDINRLGVGGVRLRDRFPRLYHLDRCKVVKVASRGVWGKEGWRWAWDWVRKPRGVVDDLVGLEEFLSHVNINLNGRDTWNWEIDDDDVFSVKKVSSVVEAQRLNVGGANFETIWNNIITKKISIFAWRTVRGKLLVRVELDRKGIDLHSVLCPMCDNACESIDHRIVFCSEVIKVWSLVFG
ncbi:putative RNA-directed DNA polymerase [Tanacetum coccineum]